ncbi:L-serine ammonia-lyase, iron-sulfur-dependent, subunit alpha [Desulfosediminicola flagellatus]|uniref:L-serine ammonia-lyase, iron-sulfur-dependent, subunit alpha n=1 Tax=Desulfosediminicola flagellatus TaxID=2569541 RepID=UPI0010AD68E1|nr:L-serine ammonia-lyase, iron-sulfur-dependent, subunit alpha [Desulfosediminicola flagellatus]
MNIPSILNDVVGPVMRGPSSSHSAAAVRIGKICRELMGGQLEHVTVHYDIKGSLPTTWISQGSDMGLSGGLLGFDADDERLIGYTRELQKANLKVSCIAGDFGDTHPNTYNLTIKNGEEEHTLVAISTGGGMIEVLKIDGLAVSYCGDCYGLVIWTGVIHPSLLDVLNDSGCKVYSPDAGGGTLVFVTRPTPYDTDLLHTIAQHQNVILARPISPVLPILTTSETKVPFTTALEMESYGAANGLRSLADLALHYEAARGGIAQDEVLKKTLYLVDVIEDSIQKGLDGTHYKDRILGYQCGKYTAKLHDNTLLNLGVLDQIIPYVTALMENKSAMGVIVAAPTAGSCGGMPGTVMAVADTMKLDRQAKARGLLAAGVIGVLIATKSTFSAEICGCQAECGVSSGMIAAAMVSMMGGEYSTSLSAASMALQNSFGMVCDPVASRVEVPCLGKNILAASNGVSCANLALAGFDHVVPFDEVVKAMDSVGRALPHELRCTALGGLSITSTSKKIEQTLQDQEHAE